MTYQWKTTSIALACSAMLFACGTEVPDGDSIGAALREGNGSRRGNPGGSEPGSNAACAAGFEAGAPGRVCNATYNGLCFESNEAACACAGCEIFADGVSSCLIAESYPTQVSCEQPDSSGGTDCPDTPISDDPNAPVSSDCAGGGSPASGGVGGGRDANPGNACSPAFEPGTPGRTCNATYNGLCFESNEAACACAGCDLFGDDVSCAIAESYPTQVSCQPRHCTGPDCSDDPVTDDPNGDSR